MPTGQSLRTEVTCLTEFHAATIFVVGVHRSSEGGHFGTIWMNSKKGSQVVTRRGVETAVLVPIEEWHRLQQGSRPTLKSLLLESGVRFEKLSLERGHLKRRPPMDFK